MLQRVTRLFYCNILKLKYKRQFLARKLNLRNFGELKSDLLVNYRKRAPNTMKIDTSIFHSVFTPELTQLSELFKRYDYELRMAGGAVRDILSGKKPDDIDFATTATPDQMKAMFESENIRMINSNGEKHGTITARFNDKENFEVTTLRIDMVTDGRHAEVRFTTDWQLDSNRRDLTINSMFLGFDGTVYDYFDGIKDLEARRVLFVGDTEKRIQEDYLRILRYFRFYGRIADYPDQYDQETLDLIKSNANGLSKISGERLWAEFRKILSGNHVESIVKTICSCNVAQYLGLPTKPDLNEFENVFQRSHHMNPQPLTLLSALTRNEDDMKGLHSRLKFSAFDRDLGSFLVEFRSKFTEQGTGSDKAHQPDLFCYKRLTFMSKLTTGVARQYVAELIKYYGQDAELKAFNEWTIPQFPLTGSIINEKGVKKGPAIGHTLHRLRQIWFDSDFKLSKEELLLQADEIVKEQIERRRSRSKSPLK